MNVRVSIATRRPVAEEVPANAVEQIAFSDGLGKVERWRLATGDPGTLQVVVQRVADGETLSAVCRSRGWPHGRVLEWLVDEEERCGRYRRAKALGAEADVDTAKAIALGSEDPKLMVDTLFRAAKSHAPDIYGERVRVERSLEVRADAALVGLASDLLGRIRALPHRVISAEEQARMLPGYERIVTEVPAEAVSAHEPHEMI